LVIHRSLLLDFSLASASEQSAAEKHSARDRAISEKSIGARHADTTS
jgi:hypothetical protein